MCLPSLTAFLFTRPSGLPLRRADLSAAWQVACTTVGLPKGTRIHDLRHASATFDARNPDMTLKELMVKYGWTTPTVAMRYMHDSRERAQQHAAYLEGVITDAKSSRKSTVARLRP